MLILMGDIHGDYEPIRQLMKEWKPGTPMAVLQLGDFGFYNSCLKSWPNPPFPVYAIDGNHEYFPIIRHYTEVSEVRPNLFFVPRGSIIELMGYKIGCCGGGFSIDKAFREEHYTWFRDEEVLNKHIEPLLNADVDFLVTHSPPESIIRRNFPPLDADYWRLPRNWKDTSAATIEILYQKHNRTRMYCGHMHQSVIDGRVQILSIAEIKILPIKEGTNG
jgi:hypothetical protein